MDLGLAQNKKNTSKLGILWQNVVWHSYKNLIRVDDSALIGPWSLIMNIPEDYNQKEECTKKFIKQWEWNKQRGWRRLIWIPVWRTGIRNQCQRITGPALQECVGRCPDRESFSQSSQWSQLESAYWVSAAWRSSGQEYVWGTEKVLLAEQKECDLGR